ncbi:MAG TPA: cysteine desulfurase family protein [Coriobacteriia bacterium]
MNGMDRTFYMDYAATTPVDPRVTEAMLPYLTEHFGNPNSLYTLGRDGYRALEAARERMASGIGAQPTEFVFTGCGTESDNEAVVCISQMVAERKNRRHLMVSAFEHHAVLHPAEWLAKNGFELTVLKPRKDGIIHAEDLQAVLREDTALVSVMAANNEIGTIQPLKDLADATHAVGAYFHTDAVQALGKIPFDVADLGVDAASFSAHKIYGPKGVGGLYLKKGTPFRPLLMGGGQEMKRRSGTQNVAGAVAFAKALELMLDEQDQEAVRLSALRDRIVDGVLNGIVNTRLNGGPPKLPGYANLIMLGCEGEAMLLQLDNKGIAVSTGSACSSGSLEPSHVLLSIGCPAEEAHGSLRVTLGRFTTDEDVDYFLEVLPPIVARLRSMNPLYERMYGAVK